MGVVKYTGPVASFHCPTNAEIRSLKVHFSPKQEGTGDPSPENVREIVGWDGVEVHESRKNMGHVIGYSASATINRTKTNTYGTTINTINYEGIHGEVVITQAQASESNNVISYMNGYIVFYPDNLIWDQKYDISFRVSNITSNPLNTTINNFKLINPYGNQASPFKIIGDRLYYKNITNKQRADTPKLVGFDIRICGMSCTISDIMITPANSDEENYEPYTDKRIVTWNQWSPSLTSDNWQAYNANNNEVTFNDGIATSTWLTTVTGYSASIRDKNGTRQSDGQIWYGSYMLKPSINSGWGLELCGGRQPKPLQSGVQANIWSQCSTITSYYRGTENYFYIANTCNVSATIGMSV